MSRVMCVVMGVLALAANRPPAEVDAAAFVRAFRTGSADQNRNHLVRGSGANPSRLTALVRALTEAAQARLTYIAGSRDDMYRASYRRLGSAHPPAATRTAQRRYIDAPTVAVVGFRETMQDLVARVRGFTGMSPVAVDLRRRELQLPVVFVVAPGLTKPDHA